MLDRLHHTAFLDLQKLQAIVIPIRLRIVGSSSGFEGTEDVESDIEQVSGFSSAGRIWRQSLPIMTCMCG